MSELDHGGGIDAAVRAYGGAAADWLDLSTGINPRGYPVHDIPPRAWASLPDSAAQHRLIAAARRAWDVPKGAAVLAAPGASALIAGIPGVLAGKQVDIPGPTYNEHRAAFERSGWSIGAGAGDAVVVVNPNNPDGRRWRADDLAGPDNVVIDESFCDCDPSASLIELADRPGHIILKSFGKFWGLGGLRLGFAIGDPHLVTALQQRLGPWPVSGPALEIGARALEDTDWANRTRTDLAQAAARLDDLLKAKGCKVLGGTTLFRLVQVDDAHSVFERLARMRILVRIFPYSERWVRFGLPGTETDWARLEAAW